MNFRDDLSRREYRISGMCQSCQDKAFGTSAEEYEAKCDEQPNDGESFDDLSDEFDEDDDLSDEFDD